MKRLRIETPASSANLGPGFDALAMTLDIVDIIHFEPDPDLDGPVLEEVTGEEAVPLDPHDNLLCKAYVAAGALIETPLPGARFRLESNIPVGKGLGSSAAAVAAGIAAARASIEVKPDIQAFLQLGAALEGHADNVSAALLGGLVTAYTDAAATHALRVASYLSLGIALFIPDCPVLTKESRQALPATVTLREAAQSIGRATYLTTALMWGRWDLLSTGMQDILHQPHRSKALPAFDSVVNAASEAGAYGAALSGGGPSVLALTPRDRVAEVAEAMEVTALEAGWNGRKRVAAVREAGVQVKEPKPGHT